MINFDVISKCKYKQLNIDIPAKNFNTGLLDDAEAITIVKQLIMAATELLPVEYDEHKKLLSDIREEL